MEFQPLELIKITQKLENWQPKRIKIFAKYQKAI